MESLANFFKHRTLILLISFLLLIAGIISYIKIPKQEMPEVENSVGFLQITAPGLNTKEVDDQVVSKVELVIENYRNVEDYTTTAMDNFCMAIVELSIDDKTAYETLEKIKTDILRIDFPSEVTEVNFNIDLTTPEIIYAVYSDTENELALKKKCEELALKIKGVKHVSKATVNSAYQQEVVVTIENEILKKTPLTQEQIFQIIIANGKEIPLGNWLNNGEQTSLTLKANYTKINQLKELILVMDETQIITLSDIATIKLDDAMNKKVYVFNGKNVAFVEIFFEEKVDFTVIGDEVQAVVDQFNDTLPKGTSVETMLFSPTHVKKQVNDVMVNLLQCIGIVMLVVLIGLGIRNAIAIAITIPVVIMTTIGCVYLLGNRFQLMSVAGLIVSIGILVDNSIVIAEAVQKALDLGSSKTEACVIAVKENSIPILTSTLTTVAAFVPLLTLPGIAGQVAYTLPLVILISISLSYIVAMVLMPSIASFWFKPKRKRRLKNYKPNKNLENIMKTIFKWSLIPVALAFGVLGVLSYAMVNELDIDILPKTERPIVYINYEYEKPNDNEGALAFAKEIEKVIKKQKDVVNYAFSQGGNLPRFYMTLGTVSNLPQNGRFFIEYKTDASQLVDYMRVLENDLNFIKGKSEVCVKRLELSKPTAPVQIVLSSNNQEQLYKTAKSIFKEVEHLSTYKSGELVMPDNIGRQEFLVKDKKLQQLQLTPIELQKQIAIAVNGQREPLFYADEQNLNVWLKSNIETEQDLLNLPIKAKQQQTTLGELASLKNIESLSYSHKYNGVPAVTLDAYMAEGVNTYELEGQIKDIIKHKTADGVTVTYKGDNKLTNEIVKGIGVAFIIALIAIYIIMYFQFQSFLQPCIVLVAIPLSFVGSLATLLLLNQTITLTALLGVVSLVGIVVNNGILLVDYINKGVKQGKGVYESCIKAVSRRLRPILLSSITTIFGILPLALFGGDFFEPIAVTFMGGLFTSTLFVLFLVPSLYYYFYGK